MFDKVSELQQKAVDKFFKEAKHRLLVGFPVGVGKTVVALRVTERYLKEVNPKAKILAVVPANLRFNFVENIKKFNLDKLIKPYVAFSFEDINDNFKYYNFFIVSYNFIAKHHSKLANKGFNLIIFDEGHYGRNPNTGFSNGMETLCKSIKDVLLLTASFIANRLSEFGRLLYYITLEPKFLYISDIKELKEYKNEFKKHVIIIAENKVNDLVKRPTPVYHRVKIPLDKYTEQVYDYVENSDSIKSFISKIKLGKWSTREVRNAIIMLQQVLLVPEYIDPQYTPQKASKFGSKVHYCLDVLKRTKDIKTIVYIPFVQAGALAVNKFFRENGIKCDVFYSGLGQEERIKLVNDYENGKLDILILTNAGKEGLNLPSTKRVIFLGYSWNPEDLTQIIGRALRVTSEHKTVDVYFYESVRKKLAILNKETIDGYMLDVIQKKKHLKAEVEKVVSGNYIDYLVEE